jgi:histidine triad (HIT) family protein
MDAPLEGPRDDNCLFCKIVAGEVPAEVVHETDRSLAFRDIEPQAPTHVLVIPRSHYENAAAVAQAEPETAVDMLNAVARIAEQENLGEGYRLVFNTGARANQLVFHAHAHVLGGRDMRWPPG